MKINSSNKIAIIDEKKISYKELISYIVSYSKFLEERKESRIVILLENRFEWLPFFLAVWKNQKIAIPLDISMNEQDLNYVLNDSEADLIIYSSKTESKISKLSINKVNIENIKIEDSTLDIVEFCANNNLLTIIYTSGTSSFPIGVKLSSDSLTANIEVLDEKGFNSKDKVIVPLPFYHAYPLSGSLQILNVGATLIIVKDVNSESLKAVLRETKPTALATVPLILEKLHKEIMKSINNSKLARIMFNISKIIPIYALRKIIFKKVHQFFGGNLRIIPCGGAHLDFNIQKDFRILGIKIAPGYGLTEAGPIVTAETSRPMLGASGKVVDGIFLKILDEEILIKGRQLMLGYQNNLGLMEEKFKDGWFYTGDLGYLKNGYLYVTGRKKELIVLANGKNIWPSEIENIINEFEPIKECALTENEGKLTLLVIPNNFTEDIDSKIKKLINDKYNSTAPSHKIINDIKILKNAIPRTRLGKIQRYRLNEII